MGLLDKTKQKSLDVLAKCDVKTLETFAKIPAAKLAKLAAKVAANPALVDMAINFNF